MVSCSESLERAKKKSRPYRISFHFGWRQRKNCPCLSYKMTTELSSLSSHSPRLCLATRRPRQVSTLMLYYVNPSDYTLKIAVSIEWFGSAGGLDPCKPEISFMFCWREHSNICEMFPIYSQQTKNSQSDAILSRRRRHSGYTKWDPTGNWLSDFGDTRQRCY